MRQRLVLVGHTQRLQTSLGLALTQRKLYLPSKHIVCKPVTKKGFEMKKTLLLLVVAVAMSAGFHTGAQAQSVQSMLFQGGLKALFGGVKLIAGAVMPGKSEAKDVVAQTPAAESVIPIVPAKPAVVGATDVVLPTDSSANSDAAILTAEDVRKLLPMTSPDGEVSQEMKEAMVGKIKESLLAQASAKPVSISDFGNPYAPGIADQVVARAAVDMATLTAANASRPATAMFGSPGSSATGGTVALVNTARTLLGIFGR
jgi:hypothetical protein